MNFQRHRLHGNVSVLSRPNRLARLSQQKYDCCKHYKVNQFFSFATW
jgi:hypothetical protein